MTETAQASSTLPPDTIKHRRKNIPISAILELHEKNLTYKQIGKLLGCDKTNISYRLQHHKAKLTGLKHYRKHKADILETIQMEMTGHLDPKTLKKMSGRQNVQNIKDLNEIIREERGQGHENITNIQNIILAYRAEVKTFGASHMDALDDMERAEIDAESEDFQVQPAAVTEDRHTQSPNDSE